MPNATLSRCRWPRRAATCRGGSAHEELDRRHEPQRLLDEVATSERSARRPRTGRVGSEREQGSRSRWRVVSLPEHEEEGELGAHLEVGEALAVDLGVEQPGDEVVGRIGRGAALGDHRVEVGGELGRDAGEALARPRSRFFVAYVLCTTTSDHSAKCGGRPRSAPSRCAITVAGIGMTYSATRSPPPRASRPSSRLVAAGRARTARPGRCGAGRSPS